MNYYERIQKSIDYMEKNMEEEITVEDCAKQAFMSVSSYYRFFLSIIGYTVKEYIRLRRLTMAARDLSEQKASVIDIAIKYDYNSADSFTRAFKKQFGILPSQLKFQNIPFNKLHNVFEKIDIMEKYFDEENKELVEKYPDIKVIRNLEDMMVACFTHIGPEPEGKAFEELKKWIKKNQISLKDTGFRIFGYNNPDPENPADPNALYGYEVCVTISRELYDTLTDVPANFQMGTYDSVKRRIIKGGKYAVLSVKREENSDMGMNIMLAWKRFITWLEEGKYVWGKKQYLEEHLGFNEEDNHIGSVELYLPIETA